MCAFQVISLSAFDVAPAYGNFAPSVLKVEGLAAFAFCFVSMDTFCAIFVDSTFHSNLSADLHCEDHRQQRQIRAL